MSLAPRDGTVGKKKGLAFSGRLSSRAMGSQLSLLTLLGEAETQEVKGERNC